MMQSFCSMKRGLAAAVTIALLGGTAWAGGNHGGHHEAGTVQIGKPGNKAEVNRIVQLAMRETDDAMMFQPDSISVAAGETILLRLTNEGSIDHEFVMDTEAGILEHKASMEAAPEMVHAEPNSIRLAPGATGEIVWTFTDAGDFVFACLLPGHYEAGMKGDLEVVR